MYRMDLLITPNKQKRRHISAIKAIISVGVVLLVEQMKKRNVQTVTIPFMR
jgi:hypothetical protein